MSAASAHVWRRARRLAAIVKRQQVQGHERAGRAADEDEQRRQGEDIKTKVGEKFAFRHGLPPRYPPLQQSVHGQ